MDPERRRITAARLRAQGIAEPRFTAPLDVVRHMFAMQAQDFGGAKWSVGLRMVSAVDDDVERALADRSIVRSWPMRGTLHLMAADDLGWLLGLTGYRTIRSAASRHRQLGLDDAAFARARTITERTLAEGPVSRTRLLAAFDDAGLSTAGLRGAHLLVWLAASRVIVFGPVDGKQHSFALFDDWMTESRDLTGDEALAELALRYFASHGPATVRDLAWWSSLTLGDVRRGIAAAGDRLELDAEHYSVANPAVANPAVANPDPQSTTLGVWALPGFDEYLLGYQDRSAALHPDHAPFTVPGSNGIFLPTIVADGEVIGTWKRTVTARETLIEAKPFERMSLVRHRAFVTAAARYGEFVGKPARVL